MSNAASEPRTGPKMAPRGLARTQSAHSSDTLTGPELQRRRLALGMKRPAFCAATGLGFRALVQWERGENPMPAHVAVLLAYLEKYGVLK